MLIFDVPNGGCSINDVDSDNEIKKFSKQIRKGAHKMLDSLRLSSNLSYQIKLTILFGDTVSIEAAPLLNMLKRLDGTNSIDINALMSILMYLMWRMDYLCNVESNSSFEDEAERLADIKSQISMSERGGEPYDLLLDRPSVVGLPPQLLATIQELLAFVVRDIEIPCWDSEVHHRLAKRARNVLTSVICHDLKSSVKHHYRFNDPGWHMQFSSKCTSDYYRFDVDGLCDICSDYSTEGYSPFDELFRLYSYAVFVDIFAEARALVFYEPLVQSLMGDDGIEYAKPKASSDERCIGGAH